MQPEALDPPLRPGNSNYYVVFDTPGEDNLHYLDLGLSINAEVTVELTHIL
jgi:hypothetical protein